MTTDERLDSLSQRVEALAQSVELLSGLQRDNEIRMAHMMDAINRLANIAGAHEQRTSDLENQ